MYLHVGNNQNIRTRNIIGVFDAEIVSPDIRALLAHNQQI